MNDRSRSAALLDAALCVVAGVAAIWAYVALFRRAPVAAFVPTFSDEVFYYKQAAGFITAGFHHGYWGDAQRVAHFGGCDTHGCGFMVATGLFGRLVGWDFARALYFNFFCLLTTVAAIGWLAPRPRRARAILLALLLLTSGLVITYVHAAMQEIFHAGGAFVLALAARRLADSPRRRALALYFAVGTALSLVRITWGVYLPLAALLVPDWPRRRRAGVAALGALLALAAFVLESLTIPGGSLIVFNEGASPLAAIVHAVVTNLKLIVSIKDTEPLYILFHATWIVLLLLTPIISRLRRITDATVTWAWLSLLALTVLQLSLYECASWRDFRVMTPPLLALMVALCLLKSPWPSRLWIAFQLVCLPIAVLQANDWNRQRAANPARAAAQARALAAILPPLASTPNANRWCRTVAVQLPVPPLDCSRLLAVPDGFGIETLRGPADAATHPARFVVTSKLPPSPDLRLLGVWGPEQLVYEKRIAGCAD